MMKRTSLINNIITVILTGSAGSFMYLATSMSSTYYGVLAIGALIGWFLNILCGSDKVEKE